MFYFLVTNIYRIKCKNLNLNYCHFAPLFYYYLSKTLACVFSIHHSTSVWSVSGSTKCAVPRCYRHLSTLPTFSLWTLTAWRHYFIKHIQQIHAFLLHTHFRLGCKLKMKVLWVVTLSTCLLITQILRDHTIINIRDEGGWNCY